MFVIPAIDLHRGRCVRLSQGSFAEVVTYSADPVTVARGYAERGASRIHLVDLDSAAETGDNAAAIEQVLAAGVAVQVAGGVRTADQAQRWLEAGAAAVVMGTAAIQTPEVVARCAKTWRGKILVALDVRGGRVATTGWTVTSEQSAAQLIERWNQLPLAGIVLTAIERDGTFGGPDLALLRQVLASSKHPVTYSGGVGSLDDVRAIAEAGAASLIVGKALYEGRFRLEEAIAAS
jgi:phosphoribosylformimino-5-aminoimidazole carboxamide ribotide isomerase